MAFSQFDPAQHVIVNKQNRPTTVYNSDRRPVTVQPWRDVGAGGVVRNPSGTYLFAGEPAREYARFIGPQGPLYVISRKEAEATLGKNFQALTSIASGRGTTTPIGESVVTSQAKVGTRAPAPAPAPAPVEDDENHADDEGEGDEIELLDADTLDGLSMPDLRAYASHWNIKGSSRKALLDKLAEEGCIADDEDVHEWVEDV